MKITKYLAVAFGIVVILLSVGWYLRNTLIERISNPILEEYDVVVTNVSLDALATDNATIGYLELVHDKGTTIAIENLTLPIGPTDNGIKQYAAEKVSIVTATREEGAPFELAQLIDQFLSLPSNLAGGEIAVDEFSLAPYPPVHNLRWVIKADEQNLAARVETVAMSAKVIRTAARNYAVTITLPPKSADATDHSIVATLQQSEKGILLSGIASLDLPAWTPMARLAGIVPPQIEIDSGTAALQFDAEIPYDISRSPSLTADVAPSSQLYFTYSDTGGAMTAIVAESGTSIEITATFPIIEWEFLQAQTSLLVTHGEWSEIPVSVNGLSCKSGPTCSMSSSISMDARRLPIGKIGGFRFSSAQNIEFLDEGLRVNVNPDATLLITGLSTPDTDVDRIEAQLVSDAIVEILDTGWRLEANSLDANVDTMSLAENISVTTPLFLEDVVVSVSDQSRSAHSGVYAPTSHAVFDQQTINLPDIKGKVSVQDANAVIELATVGLYQDGTISAQHNLDAGTGRLSVGGTAVSFNTQTLSNRVLPWRQDWDLNSGTVSFDLFVGWQNSDSDLELIGQASAQMSDLAGKYADTAFAGVSTKLDIDYNHASGFRAKPANLNVALVEMGLPIENISADYVLDPDSLAVEVESLRMSAFGGVITADPFTFDSQSDSNTLLLRADSIDLSDLLSIKEFEDIEVSGSIGAELPVTIGGDAITIVGGTLTGEAPGGVIRYRPGIESDGSDDSSIGLVTRALSNFEYESLTSELDYSEDGDLILKMQLTGRNPDLDETRPVVLNLGVESNIPKMLKSLQAARAVEDILEQRLEE